MATHTHLGRASDDVTPEAVEAFRVAIREVPAGSLRTHLDDLLRALCAVSYTGADVVVDITYVRDAAECSRSQRSHR